MKKVERNIRRRCGTFQPYRKRKLHFDYLKYLYILIENGKSRIDEKKVPTERRSYFVKVQKGT